MNTFNPNCLNCKKPLKHLGLNLNGFPKYQKCNCLIKREANSGSFKKGHVTWNKGLKGIHLSPETEFKKGQFTGSEHPSWKGGEQINSNDCVYVYAGANKRIRRPRKVYQDAHGEIPKGWILYHIDKDMHNDNLDNLIAIPRAVLVMLNANRINGNYQEIKSAVEKYKNKNKYDDYRKN
jgi:hypothetical protein